MPPFRIQRAALLISFLCLGALLVAAAPAQSGTPPPPTPTPTLIETCLDEKFGKCLVEAWGRGGWLTVGLLAIIGLAVLLVIAYGQGWLKGLTSRGEAAAGKAFRPGRDLTRYYLQKFIAENEDPRFTSLTMLARDIPVPKLERIYLPVRAVFEPLETERAAGGKVREGKTVGAEFLEGRVREPAEPLELAQAIKQSPRLAILGAAGSGKSTLLQWAGLTCARAGLKQKKLDEGQRAFIKALGSSRPLLPVFVPLGAFDRHCQARGKLRTAADLLAFLIERFNHLHPPLDGPGLPADFFARQLRRGGLLLFDGVDEVAPDHRGAVRRAVQEVLDEYPQARTRALITSRPAAYFGDALISGFRPGRVAPLDDARRDSLIRSLYGVYDSNNAARRSQDLIRRINASVESVRNLACTPLMVTIFTIVHRADRQLPQQRAELYEEAVTTLLEERYRKDEAEAQLAADYDANQRRDLLALIAFHLHDRRVGDEGLPDSDLIDLIWQKFGGDSEQARPAAREFIYAIARRGGLLEEQDQRFGFRSHRTFQEFLAGRHLVGGYAPFDLPKQAAFLAARLGDDHWEEPARLAVGVLAFRSGEDAVNQFLLMLNGLSGDDMADDRASAIAGLALSDLSASRLKDPHPTRAALRKAMRVVFERNPPRLEAPLRRRLGLALGALGDPRFPLGRVPALVTIPAGEFRMGTSMTEAEQLKAQKAESWDDEKPQHTVFVSEFQIGRYPVTNAEYRAFAEVAQGYENKDYWSAEGWRWRTGQLETDLSVYSKEYQKSVREWLARRPSEKRGQPFFWDDPQWNASNLPVVGVTWYEAEAYCNWLSVITGQKFRLPTEAEWEKVARGPTPSPGPSPIGEITDGGGVGEGLLWPWGNKWDAERCNSEESKLNATTPVGMYPHGAALWPNGSVEDLVGNVWEWCQSKYVPYPYKADDGRENLDGGDARVLRGGSYIHDRRYCRAASRDGNEPGNFNGNLGFRVALSP